MGPPKVGAPGRPRVSKGARGPWVRNPTTLSVTNWADVRHQLLSGGIESLLRRELHFADPGPLQMSLKFAAALRCSQSVEGVWGTPGKSERTRAATALLHNAYRDSKAELGVLRKQPCASWKAQSIAHFLKL